MLKNEKKILIIAVAGLILLRIFSLFVIPYFPHLEQFKYNNYFSAIHEGDDTGYYIMAKMIYDFDFKKDATMLGYSFMIVPFIAVFGENFNDIFFPLIIFNGVILFSLTLILIVWTSFIIFKKILPAVFSGLLFVLFPFIFYLFRNFGRQFKTGAWNDINFFHVNWLAMMADQPAAFFTMLILFLLIITEEKKLGLSFYPLIGFLTGFSVMVRITNVVIILAVSTVIFLFEKDKKYKKLFFYFLFSLIAFLPQFAYNAAFFSSPASFGYQEEYRTAWVEAGSARGIMWSFGNFFHLFSRAARYSLFSIPVFLALFVFTLTGILRIMRMNKHYAFTLCFCFFSLTLIYMFFQTGQTAMRYYLPAIPPFIIISLAAFLFIKDYFSAFLRRIERKDNIERLNMSG